MANALSTLVSIEKGYEDEARERESKKEEKKNEQLTFTEQCTPAAE